MQMEMQVPFFSSIMETLCPLLLPPSLSCDKYVFFTKLGISHLTKMNNISRQTKLKILDLSY